MADESRVLTRDKVEEIVASIIKEESIENATIEIESGSAKGDGYMSFVTKVDINGNKDLHLMIKTAPKMEEIRKLFPVRDIFLREIYFYDVIVKEFAKFEKERGIFEPSINAPKCYKTNDEDGNECLTLENIKEQGFQMWNRKIQMGEEHIKLVFKQYAKYHAVSYAIRDQNSELNERLLTNLDPIFDSEAISSDMFTQFFENSRAACSSFDPIEEKDIYDTMQKFIDNLPEWYLSIEKDKSKNSVIIHGDCWCNNMMFKYKDNSKPTVPTEVCMLDFQLVQHASPMLDLSYFFLVSASAKILENFKYYLEIYYESLKQHYEDLGGNSDNLLSFDELLNEWKVYAKYGFSMALTVFKVMLIEGEEALDLNDVRDNKVQLMDMFSGKIKNDDIYQRMVRVLATYMFTNGLF